MNKKREKHQPLILFSLFIILSRAVHTIDNNTRRKRKDKENGKQLGSIELKPKDRNH